MNAIQAFIDTYVAKHGNMDRPNHDAIRQAILQMFTSVSQLEIDQTLCDFFIDTYLDKKKWLGGAILDIVVAVYHLKKDKHSESLDEFHRKSILDAETIETLKRAVQNRDDKIAQLNGVLAVKTKQNDEHEKEITENAIQTTLAKKISEYDQLKKACDGYVTHLNNAIMDRNRYQDQIRFATEDHKSLKERLDKAERELNKKEDNIKALEAERDKYVAESHKRGNYINDMTTEIENLKNQAAEHVREYAVCSNNCASLSKQLYESKRECETHQKRIQELEELLNKSKSKDVDMNKDAESKDVERITAGLCANDVEWPEEMKPLFKDTVGQHIMFRNGPEGMAIINTEMLARLLAENEAAKKLVRVYLDRIEDLRANVAKTEALLVVKDQIIEMSKRIGNV